MRVNVIGGHRAGDLIGTVSDISIHTSLTRFTAFQSDCLSKYVYPITQPVNPKGRNRECDRVHLKVRGHIYNVQTRYQTLHLTYPCESFFAPLVVEGALSGF